MKNNKLQFIYTKTPCKWTLKIDNIITIQLYWTPKGYVYKINGVDFNNITYKDLKTVKKAAISKLKQAVNLIKIKELL